MNEEFPKQRALLIRDLADKADPFTRQRLLHLTKRYENPRHVPFRAIPHPLANLPCSAPAPPPRMAISPRRQKTL